MGGEYPPMSEHFSKELKDLVASLLNTNPEKRLDIHGILGLPLIQNQIRKHINEEQFQDEFSHTVIHNTNIFELAFKRKEEEERQAKIEADRLAAAR